MAGGEARVRRDIAIHTTGSSASVVVAEGGVPVAGGSVRTRAASSELVMALVDRALTDTGTAPADVEAVYACRGPGSFTGIRVGLATARGLALGFGVPLRTVTAFEAALHGFPDYPGPVAVLIDARRGQLYAQGFGGLPDRARTEARVLDPSALVSFAAEAALVATLPVALAGSGCDAFDAAVRTAFKAAWRTPERPGAEGVLGAAMAGLATEGLDPVYLRPPDAKLPRT